MAKKGTAAEVDEILEIEEEEEEEAPRVIKKKKKKAKAVEVEEAPKAKKVKKKVRVEYEEEEPAPKKKRGRPAKVRHEEEEEEEEAPRRRGRPRVNPPREKIPLDDGGFRQGTFSSKVFNIIYKSKNGVTKRKIFDILLAADAEADPTTIANNMNVVMFSSFKKKGIVLGKDSKDRYSITEINDREEEEEAEKVVVRKKKKRVARD